MHAVAFVTEGAEAGADGGVDIVAGRDVVGFDRPRVAVQVESSQRLEVDSATRELQSALATYDNLHNVIGVDVPIERMRTPARDPQ